MKPERFIIELSEIGSATKGITIVAESKEHVIRILNALKKKNCTIVIRRSNRLGEKGEIIKIFNYITNGNRNSQGSK